MAGPSTSTYAILGLLSLTPMSGYEAAQWVERSIAYFWPLSKTHVYSELARLEALGWAQAEDVRQDALPDKRVFEITPAGERALDEWLLTGALPLERHRLPFLIKLFIGHRIPREKLREMLQAYREEADEERRALEQIVDTLEGITKAAYPRATALLGLRMAEGAVRWVDEVEEELPARRVTIDPRGEEAEKAKTLFDAAPPRPRPGRAR